MSSFSTRCLSSSLILLSAACSSTATSAVTDAALIETTARRAALEDVELALRIADLGPLAVPVTPAPAELRPDHPEFWQAAALAWNPELRQMRRRVRELRAATDSAGRPGPIVAEAGARDLSNISDESELQITFDVLGLLALGPSAAAKDFARAQERALWAELESTVWKLRFEVDRARVRLAGSKALAAAMTALYNKGAEELPRIELLTARGWLARAMYEGANASLHMAEHRASMAKVDIVRNQAELAALCGLDVAHPAFDELDGGAIDRFRSEDLEFRDPLPAELLASLPELRARRLELSMAEAELRRETREQWPMLRVGPTFAWMPGESFLGGMLELDLPFPGALDGRIAAALERREAAREALEDALVAAQSRVKETHDALDELLFLFDEHAPELDQSVARMLVATQAEFRVDPEKLDKWSLALRERVESLTALVQARTDVVIAQLDYEEARGITAEVRP